jgi:hypothetical protein
MEITTIPPTNETMKMNLALEILSHSGFEFDVEFEVVEGQQIDATKDGISDVLTSGIMDMLRTRYRRCRYRSS